MFKLNRFITWHFFLYFR